MTEVMIGIKDQIEHRGGHRIDETKVGFHRRQSSEARQTGQQSSLSSKEDNEGKITTKDNGETCCKVLSETR